MKLKHRTLLRSRSATLNALSALCFPLWSKSEKSDVALKHRTLLRSRSAILNALSALCFPLWSKSEKSDVALAFGKDTSDLAPPAIRARPPMKLAWVCALLIATAFHSGGFAYVASTARHEDPDDAPGAAVLEIGLDMTSPHEDHADLPLGPAAQDAMASTATVEKTAKVEDVDAPKEKPTEPEDADRLVAPDVKKIVKDETPKVEESKANAAPESVASEAAAPPHIETAREAPIAAAPAIGTGESAQRVRTTWQKELVAHLNRFKRYPTNGARRPGEILVAFTLDRLGHVVSSKIVRGSGDPAFDQAALAMMAKADPLPPPPPLVADEGLTFSIPVIFRDKKR